MGASLRTAVRVVLPVLTGAFGTMALTACSRDVSEADIYRTAVADLATLLAPQRFCVSTTQWYGAEPLSAEVRDALAKDGLQFLDPTEVPDTSARLLTLSSIREDSSGFRLTADVGQIVGANGAYWWEGADYDYTIHCRRGECLVAERSGPGSSHAGVGAQRVNTIQSGAAIRCPG